MFSPDGAVVAYVSRETGRPEVFVSPFPGPGERLQVSGNGGIIPRWARSGRELFYRTNTHMMAVTVRSSSGKLVADAPKPLFDVTRVGLSFDVARDGRFLITRPARSAAERSRQVMVVVNWFDELRRLAPAK